jgi:hypothetical protein
MTHAISPISPTWISLLPNAPGSGLAPFEREIRLLECHVAGTSFRELDDAEERLVPGLALVLSREPKNEHDERAILIRAHEGPILGYVPRDKNEVLASLMDAGKILLARVTSTARRGRWLEIRIELFMRDL